MSQRPIAETRDDVSEPRQTVGFALLTLSFNAGPPPAMRSELMSRRTASQETGFSSLPVRQSSLRSEPRRSPLSSSGAKNLPTSSTSPPTKAADCERSLCGYRPPSRTGGTVSKSELRWRLLLSTRSNSAVRSCFPARTGSLVQARDALLRG